MLGNLREIGRQAIPVSKIEDSSISWHNTAFIVRTSKTVHVFEFSYNVNCMDKRLDFIESILPTPKSSPATYLLSNNFIRYGVSNFELSQLIINPTLWPHSAQIVEEMTCAIDCKWSPDFYFDGDPLLAVLNNIGNVTIYGKKNGAWVKLLDLSAYVNKELNLVLPTCVEDLKTKAEAVESSALCFTSSNPESCSIILGQKNGSLLLWSLKVENNEKLKAYFQGCIESDTYEVKSILWIDDCVKNKQFVLVVSNILGQIILYLCSNCSTSNNIKMQKMHLIWPHKDNMITQYLFYTQVNNRIILLFDKHRHFVVQMLGSDYKVKSQYAEIVNDYKISSIAVNSNEFLLATVNFQMYNICIDITNDNLDVRLVMIGLKDSYKNYELADMSLSQNNNVIAVAAMDRSISGRKKTYQIDILFLSTDSNHDCNMSFLLHNKVKTIIGLWDAIELLRNNMLKSKTLPKDELEKLLRDGDTDIFKLKLYLVIANIWIRLVNNLKVPKASLPEDIEKVKDKVLLKHAQKQLNEMYNLIVQNNMSNFDIEIFIATKRYLDYHRQKYNVKLDKLISPAVYNSVNEERKYVCQCCDEELDGFSCSSGHMNMFCPISFLPIETNDYLVCVVCGITARVELNVRRVKCIFCDKFLQKYCI